MRVEQMLRPVLGQCRLVHAARKRALIAAVEAVIRGGRVTLTAIGRSYATTTTAKHAIKRADRLVGNFRLWAELLVVLRALTLCLARGVARPIVLIDWTGIGDGTRQCALVASIPVAGRAIPILFEVHPIRRYGNSVVHRRFLSRLSIVLPARCCPIVVADAGFKMPFYRAVDALGWGYVIRVRGSNRRFARQLRMPDLLRSARAEPRDVGDLLLARDGFGPRLILGARPKGFLRRNSDQHRRAALDPWLLASNLWRHAPDEIVALYAVRMKIEEMFRDLKSHRFGWGLEEARSERSERLELLHLVAALANFVVVMVGLAAESQGLHRRFQANTIRNRRVLSAFHIGRFILLEPSLTKLDSTTIRFAASEHRRTLKRSVRNIANGTWWKAHCARLVEKRGDP